MSRNHWGRRTVAAVAAGFLIFGVAACSSDGDSTTAEVSEMSKDELLEFLVSEGTTQEEAVRIHPKASTREPLDESLHRLHRPRLVMGEHSFGLEE